MADVSRAFCERCAQKSSEEEMEGNIPKVKRSVEKCGRYAKAHTGNGKRRFKKSGIHVRKVHTRFVQLPIVS